MGYLADITRKLGDEQDIIFVGTGIILVDNKGRILLACRTDNNEWCLPGGSLEVNETLTQCIVRETKEETNIIIDENRLYLNSAEAILEPIIKNGRKIFVVSISYWTDTYDDIDMSLDSREFTKYGWFSKNEISKLGRITPYSEVALKKYYGGHTNNERNKATK